MSLRSVLLAARSFLLVYFPFLCALLVCGLCYESAREMAEVFVPMLECAVITFSSTWNVQNRQSSLAEKKGVLSPTPKINSSLESGKTVMSSSTTVSRSGAKVSGMFSLYWIIQSMNSSLLRGLRALPYIQKYSRPRVNATVWYAPVK